MHPKTTTMEAIGVQSTVDKHLGEEVVKVYEANYLKFNSN